MCGIIGVASLKENNEHKFNVSCELLNHRGPNGFGTFKKNNVILGHKRLSILDLSPMGNQPMISTEKGVAITVNGEIYNFESLRNELKYKYCFKSNSDSEVVLWGYIEWGIDKLINKLDGMFAISIYDFKEELIYLVRDRAGIKPLFYYFDGNEIYWSSELEPIKSYYSLEIDSTALYDFLTYRFIPHPKTLYKNVYKLPQAHILKFELNSRNINLKKYWNCFDIVERDLTFSEAVEESEFLLRKSIKEQLVSDVPLGAFLSGGVDSSLVTLFAHQEAKNKNIKTYTIGFKNNKQDESKYAEIASKVIGTRHNCLNLSEDDILNLIDKNNNWYSEPFYDPSSIPTYLVSKLASESSTVILGGDGADELFGGYDWYRKYNNNNLNSLTTLYEKIFGIDIKIANKINRRVLKNFIYDELTNFSIAHGSPLGYEKKSLKNELEVPDDYDDLWAYRRYYKKSLSEHKRFQLIDFNMFMVDGVLTKVDRLSMRNSIEVRVPFLSNEMINFALSLKEEILYKNGPKSILKSIYYKTFKDEIFKRKKQGFSLPIMDWKGSLKFEKYPHESQIKEFNKI
ncbi:asparagine synthase (glutamine-hydrolyzing) [Photobacterium leiognathi]|uniref:asparagine synthase (glutamine-hydrolyzing) n=1 Tax=Photobacterium leiognathi TaxID=553611 RepID=UPI0029811615|nr:asparagine synthase (glutamine-hydrolyzing) [Photobacterium leiognathi]